MKYLFLILLFSFLPAGTTVSAQVTMGFENLSTTQTCGTTACNYTDPISSLVAHDLPDVGGIPVNSPSTATILGFKSSFRPTRTGSSNTGLNDGDFFGYAGGATIANNVGQSPTEGAQAFILEDTDGEVTLTINLVDLARASSTFSMDYIIDGGFELDGGGDDLLKVSLNITGCPAATTIDLFHGTGTAAGGTTNLNSIADGVWMTATQNLAAFSACKVQLEIIADLKSSTEEFAFDNIRFTGGATLPVEFMAFTANPHKENIMLDWSTAIETDNEGFSVERSIDGASFTSIGYVNGYGDTGNQVGYQFEEENVVAGQEYYYRLRQEDYDGAFDYFSIVTVRVDGDNGNTVAGKVYPNPATDGRSNIELFAQADGQWPVSVIDANGRLVSETHHDLTAGYNLLQLNLRSQPVGAYLVRVAGKEGNGCPTGNPLKRFTGA
jgi:hypothetical protein